MPWILMHEDWAVQIENGIHTIHAEIIFDVPRKLKITLDGEVEWSPVWLLAGKLKSFPHNGHSFELRVRTITIWSDLVLLMDGLEVPPIDLVLIEDLIVQESEEGASTEEYPLDNRFGDRDLNIEREVSRESTNELDINEGREISGGFGLEAIEAEIKVKFYRETGHKIGEKVTERHKLNFSVGPRKSVLYKVVWRRKVRSGKRRYLLAGNPLTIPYRISYGLSYEVTTEPFAGGS